MSRHHHVLTLYPPRARYAPVAAALSEAPELPAPEPPSLGHTAL